LRSSSRVFFHRSSSGFNDGDWAASEREVIDESRIRADTADADISERSDPRYGARSCPRYARPEVRIREKSQAVVGGGRLVISLGSLLRDAGLKAGVHDR
jgi:hypothetical protein